jgi:hypothetical protein
MTDCRPGARQISSAPSPGGEGWDEGEQLFAPKRHHLIRRKKSVLHSFRRVWTYFCSKLEEIGYTKLLTYYSRFDHLKTNNP